MHYLFVGLYEFDSCEYEFMCCKMRVLNVRLLLLQLFLCNKLLFSILYTYLKKKVQKDGQVSVYEGFPIDLITHRLRTNLFTQANISLLYDVWNSFEVVFMGLTTS
jgi:hypothetical protein